MHAIIMAGGLGSRLRPLTCNRPKPLAEVCGKAVIEYIFELLIQNGIDKATIALMYQGERISERYPEHKYQNLHLDFRYETISLGTAGSVKMAAGEEEEVLVISGDALCDFDLSQAIEFHKKNNADATIIAKRVDDPREYGLINKDESGKITGFVEKPPYCSCTTDLANTGIYILSKSALDLIPGETEIDFASDIFPEMLKRGMKLFCFEESGYWCDIGDFASYIRCQRDILDGKVKCDVQGHKSLDGVIYKDSSHFENVSIIPPAYIGKNVKIGSGTVIESGSVIGDNVNIGERSKVHGAVIGDGVYIGNNVTCNMCVLCPNSKMLDGSAAYEYAVCGDKAIIGQNATLESGVKVWPNKQVECGTSASVDVKYQTAKKTVFDDDGIFGEAGGDITPGVMTRLGASAGELVKSGAVGVASFSGDCSESLRLAFASGVMSAGKNVVDFGECSLPQFEFCLEKSGISVGAHIESNENICVRFCRQCGLPITRSDERKLEGGINRNEYKRADKNGYGEYSKMFGFDKLYSEALAESLPQKLNGTNVIFESENITIGSPLDKILRRINDSSGKIVTFSLSAAGRRLFAQDDECGIVSHEMLVMLACDAVLKEGKEIAVPTNFPDAIDELAGRYGKTAWRFYACPCGNSDENAREIAKKNPFLFDGMMLAAKVLSYLQNENITLSKAVSNMPQFYFANRSVMLSKNPLKIIKNIDNNAQNINEGVSIKTDNGRILIRPKKNGLGILLFAESKKAEAASELCNIYEKKIKSLSDND